MDIKFKKLNKLAVVPTKAHPTDAGFDLTAISVVDKVGTKCYGTGIAVEIPKGYVGLIFPRSSVYKQRVMLSNSVGVIDSGYRGEIMVSFYANTSSLLINQEFFSKKGTSPLMSYNDFSSTYAVGDRIAQLVIMPYPEVTFVEANELEDSDRGEGGFGSTGR